MREIVSIVVSGVLLGLVGAVGHGAGALGAVVEWNEMSPIRIPPKYHYEEWGPSKPCSFVCLSNGQVLGFHFGGGPFIMGRSDSARAWAPAWATQEDIWTPFVEAPSGGLVGVVRLGREIICITEGIQVWRSSDEGATWVHEEPFPVKPEGCPRAFALRPIVTSTGRLILPIDCLLGEEGPGPEQIGTVVSDDAGRTWTRSPLFGPPPGYPDRPEGFSEPHVVELADGRIWMVFRACLGHLWQAFSTDGGLTWGEPTSTGLVAPLANCKAYRIPGTDAVLLVWNCAKPGSGGNWPDIPHTPWGPRSPLVFAVSYDNCQTWSRPVIIDDGYNLVYPNAYISDTEVFIFYPAAPTGNPETGEPIYPDNGVSLAVYDLSTVLAHHPAGDPNPVASGGPIQCSVGAQDPLAHTLSYQWQAVDGAGNPAGSFDEATKQNPIWTAPENTTGTIAEYEVRVTIRCPEGQWFNASHIQQVNPAL